MLPQSDASRVPREVVGKHDPALGPCRGVARLELTRPHRRHDDHIVRPTAVLAQPRGRMAVDESAW